MLFAVTLEDQVVAFPCDFHDGGERGQHEAESARLLVLGELGSAADVNQVDLMDDARLHLLDDATRLLLEVAKHDLADGSSRIVLAQDSLLLEDCLREEVDVEVEQGLALR